MSPTPSLVEDFYQVRHGAAVAHLLRARLALLWPSVAGMRVLGLGHARPYLPLWHDDAAVAAELALVFPVTEPWTEAGHSLTASVDGDTLPLDDLSVDRILLVHGLETAPDARRLLRECWRVLRDDGRLLLVTPNRAGVWAHVESTPFGQGEPYSPGQLGRLLRAGMFSVERRDAALFLPPLDLATVLRFGALADRIGRRLTPGFGGVLLTEAVKDVYAAIPLAAPRRGVVARPAPRRALVAAAGRTLAGDDPAGARTTTLSDA